MTVTKAPRGTPSFQQLPVDIKEVSKQERSSVLLDVVEELKI